MKTFMLILLIIFLNSCEKIIYGEYEIFKGVINEKTPNFYKVKKGDNLYTIAKKNRISLKKIIEVNNISFPYKISPNQIIYLPIKRSHKIQKGETIYSISRKYGVDRYYLSKINNIKFENKIFAGETLIIPDHNNKVDFSKAKNLKSKKKIIKKANSVLNSSINFVWPVKGKIILKFGEISSGYHNDGINIESKIDKPVSASADGKIIYTGNEIPGYGNLILIKHKNNWITAYSHLNRINYKRGQIVKKGEKIGTIGNTGNVDSPQLHFEIRKGKKAFNPIKYLS